MSISLGVAQVTSIDDGLVARAVRPGTGLLGTENGNETNVCKILKLPIGVNLMLEIEF